VPPYGYTGGWRPNEGSFGIQQHFIDDVISPIRAGITGGTGYGSSSGYYLNADAQSKWNAIAADLNTNPNPRII
jgi:hypothetical protein